MWFSYDGDSFDLHDAPEKAKAVAHCALDDYRDLAVDGWCDEADHVCWGHIIESATVVSSRTRTDEDFCDSSIDTVVEIEMLVEEEGLVRELLESREKMDRSGLDLSPCATCGQTVICIPDGLSPMCE